MFTNFRVLSVQVCRTEDEEDSGFVRSSDRREQTSSN